VVFICSSPLALAAAAVCQSLTAPADRSTHNTQVNAILPGWITTDMTAPIKKMKDLYDTIIGRTPASRFGEPEECAGVRLRPLNPARPSGATPCSAAPPQRVMAAIPAPV